MFIIAYVPHEQFSDEHVTLQILRRPDAKSNTRTSRLADSAVKVHFWRELERQVLTVRRECHNANGRESKYSSSVSEVRKCILTRVNLSRTAQSSQR